MKKVLITGVTGQIGSFMVDYLLKETEHTIIGGIRRLSVNNHKNIEHIKDSRFSLIDLDITDQTNVSRVIREECPDYFINCAANSFVGNSWDMPVNHFETNAMAVIYQLEAIRQYAPNCRYLNMGSSEEFGDVDYSPQDIKHPMKPRSPYGASKCAAHHLIKVYRESYNLYALQVINFNTESERRGEEFVTMKIAKGVARIARAIKYGLPFEPIVLGNMAARRDWQYAGDCVDGIWKILHQEKLHVHFTKLKDYILASGEAHSIRDFVEKSFDAAGVKGQWTGKDLTSRYMYSHNNIVSPLVKNHRDWFRPAEVELLMGDSLPASVDLGWEPSTSFDDLVKIMVKHEQRLLQSM